MEAVVKALLLIYASILLLNAVFSAFWYFSHRDKLYQYSLYLWLSTFVNALLQGIFQGSSRVMILCFSTYFLCSLMLVKILSLVGRRSFPLKGYGVLFGLGILGSFTAQRLNLGFELEALPVALGITYPMFHSAFVILFSTEGHQENRTLLRVFSGLLVINALHFLDYPFLRTNPQFSVFGFSLALAILMAFSIFLPSFLIKDVSDRYSEKVTLLNSKLMDYQRQMAELMSLAQIGEMSFSFIHDMASPTTLLMHYSREISSLHAQGGKDRKNRLVPYSKGIEQATARLVGLQRLFRALIRKEVTDAPVEIDLRDTVHGVIDLFRPFLELHGIEIGAKLVDRPFRVVSIQGVVERVLLNLIQNAVDALMDREVRKIEISLSECEGGFLLQVRDTGPGISMERVAQLWERFGHSDTAQKVAGGARSRPGGSGFGLYKVKQLVESVHGAISVETSPSGTCFAIVIPKSISEKKVAA